MTARMMEANPSKARQRLLDAALAEFAKNGFAGASIRTMTRALGLRESAFYAHFPSKQAIYDELFAEGGPAVVARWSEEVSPDAPPAGTLEELAGHVMEAWRAPRARALASVVLREVFAGNSDKRTALLAGIEEALTGLERLFQHWQSKGAIREDVLPRHLAFEFVAPLVLTRFLYYNQAATHDDIAQGLRRVAQHVAAFIRMTGAQR